MTALNGGKTDVDFLRSVMEYCLVYTYEFEDKAEDHINWFGECVTKPINLV